jgi:hypothetical protein
MCMAGIRGQSKVNESKRRAIVAAKAAGKTDQQAADAVGVCRMTVHNVLKDPGTREIFREIVASLDQELQQLAVMVIKTLAQDLVSAQNETSRSRLREEALKTMAHLRTLGNFGMQVAGDGTAVGGGAKTLGDILVQVSHTAHGGGTTTATVAKPTFHD